LVLGEKARPDSYSTLSTLHYKALFRFLRKFNDFKCALWSKKYSAW